MPEILPSTAPAPRAVLGYDGTDFRVYLVDTSGHIQADVLSTVMDADAATEATLEAVKDRLGALTAPAAGSVNKLLTDALTALQLIDNLQAALHSVNTDELVVQGEDQLFSLLDPLVDRTNSTISGAAGYADSGTPAAGLYWIVTSCAARDRTSATTARLHTFRRGGVNGTLYQDIRAYAQWEWSVYQGLMVLANTDVIRVEFSGALANDSIDVDLVGYVMTAD